MKKIIILFTINLVFLLFAVAASAEAGKPTPATVGQSGALSAYDDLSAMTASGGAPYNYAGEYIDGTELVILISTDDETPYLTLTKRHSCIRFERVKYSKKELQTLFGQAVDLLNGSRLLETASINVQNNSVCIEINAAEYLKIPEMEREERFLDGVNYKLVNTTNALNALIAAEKEGTRGWNEIDGEKYYIKKDGTLATKSTTIDGIRYRFSAKGVCTGKYSGWTSSAKGRRCWRGGKMLADRSFTVRGVKYYADKNGYASPAA